MDARHRVLSTAIALFLGTPPATAASLFTATATSSSTVSSTTATTAPEATAVESTVEPVAEGDTAPTGTGGPITAEPASEGGLVPMPPEGGVTAEPVSDAGFAPIPPEDWVYSDFHGEWVRFRDSSYQGKYQVPVKVIQTCNSDGTNCSAHNPSDPDFDYKMKRRTLYHSNATFQNSGGLVKFEFDDPDDLTRFVHDDYLSMDCVPNPAVVPEQITDPQFEADQICDRTSVVAARNALALQYPGRLVVFPRRISMAAIYDEALGHWTIGSGLTAYAGDHYLAVGLGPTNDDDGKLNDQKVFAHEAGHYLGLPHTFRQDQPGSIAAVAARMAEHLEDQGIEDLGDPSVATGIFDADNLSAPAYPVPPILDTPADPGRRVFRDAFGGSCDGSVLVVPVTWEVGGEAHAETVLLHPDQQNIMSYFYCGTPHELHYSPDQVARMEWTLTGGRQSHLTQNLGARSSCYGRGVYDADGPGPSDPAELAAALERLIDCFELYDPESDLVPLGTVAQLEFELALARVDLPPSTSTTRRLRTRTLRTVESESLAPVSALAAYWTGNTWDADFAAAASETTASEAPADATLLDSAPLRIAR